MCDRNSDNDAELQNAIDTGAYVASGLAMWWISGGVYGLLSLAGYYCAPAVPAVWNDGLEAVMSIPSFEETFVRHPPNRELLLAPFGAHAPGSPKDG